MNKNLVGTVTRIPREFYRRGDVSVRSLVLESGYLDDPEALTLDGLRDFLRIDPQLIEDWLRYSESKRTPEGWYFRQQKSGAWEVGLVPETEPLFIGSNVDACAMFILREIASIASGNMQDSG
jgi:hypothetical protein